jgi:hypothetical protein
MIMLDVSCVLYATLTCLVGAVVIDAATYVLAARRAVRARAQHSPK